MQNHEMQEIYTCVECDTRVKGYQRFCHNCGAYLGSDTERISLFNNSNLQTAFFFYVVYLFICLTVKYTNWFASYHRLFWIEILIAVITILFARINLRSLKPVLKFHNFSWYTLFTVIAAAIVFSSVVNVFITQINISIFGTNISLYEGYRTFQFPVLLMFYSVALVPALFEELAFRGILYNYLNTFLDERLVVMVTGVGFGAIYLKFIYLKWLVT
jgi:membrane protease YdiL (CAAX protease family)